MLSSQDLHKKVKKALKQFFHEDVDLLCLTVNERSITHKIAEHLQREFKDLKVDCEYNRHGSETKTLPVKSQTTSSACLDATTVYPDIIVHRRGCDSNNLLVIEVKKSNGGDANRDKCKLQKFTEPNGEYEYKLGLFLEIDLDKKGIKYAVCFTNGAKIEECVDCKSLCRPTA